MTETPKLKAYFPMLKNREEVKKEIREQPNLYALYCTWKDYQQEEFLDFCTGVKGVKMMYDSFFKEVFNPEYDPERLSDFLSELLGQRVKVLYVLPNDTIRIADEMALVITDVVVELEDGSVVNVEVQKIGYMFPGQRASCYSADLLLRQYKRIRDQKKKKFSYKDVKPVYVIVLFEESPKEFHGFDKDYIHHFRQESDTGLKLNLLQEYYFVSLDTFKKELENKGIKTKLDAWFVFLSTDEPEYIIRLLEEYPEFKPLYEDVYQICRNVEKVMGLFSEELRELDRNTVSYMIDTMQEELARYKEKDAEQQELIQQLRLELAAKNHQ